MLINYILDIKWPTLICEDKLIWKGNSDGRFSVKNCFQLNFANEEKSVRSDCWSKLWGLEIHDRLKLFLWRMMAGVLPSKEILAERLGVKDKRCAICGKEVESYFHVFKECHGIRVLGYASKWGCRLDYWNVANLDDLVQLSINPNSSPSIQGTEEGLIYFFYCYWNYRNSFDHGKPERMEKMVIIFNHLVEE